MRTYPIDDAAVDSTKRVTKIESQDQYQISHQCGTSRQIVKSDRVKANPLSLSIQSGRSFFDEIPNLSSLVVVCRC